MAEAITSDTDHIMHYVIKTDVVLKCCIPSSDGSHMST